MRSRLRAHRAVGYYGFSTSSVNFMDENPAPVCCGHDLTGVPYTELFYI